jgi:hypothetical protein
MRASISIGFAYDGATPIAIVSAARPSILQWTSACLVSGAGVVEGNHSMADTHRKDGVPAVCEIAVKKNLLKIPESWAPAPNQVDLEAIDWL